MFSSLPDVCRRKNPCTAVSIERVLHPLQAAFHITCCIAWLGKISSSLVVLYWPGCWPVLAGVLRYFFSASCGGVGGWGGSKGYSIFIYFKRKSVITMVCPIWYDLNLNPPCRCRDIHIWFMFVVAEQRVQAVLCFVFFS